MHLIIPIATVVLLLCAGPSVLASPNHPTTPTYHIPATKSQYDHNPGNKHPSLLPINDSNNSYCPPSTLPPVSAEQQRILFNDFVQILHVDRDFYKAYYTYVAIDSIVHDPFSKGQGRDVVIAALKPIWPTDFVLWVRCRYRVCVFARSGKWRGGAGARGGGSLSV